MDHCIQEPDYHSFHDQRGGAGCHFEAPGTKSPQEVGYKSLYGGYVPTQYIAQSIPVDLPVVFLKEDA